MTVISILRATAMGITAVLLLVPVVLADTCCANIPVVLDPPAVMPRDVVRLVGLRCLNADNTGPLPLNLGAFWLATGTQAADPDPASAPGPGLPGDLPPVDKWLPFASVPDRAATSGDATIVVPDLPHGTYQLWWWCDDGSGPGGGIHYSTGPRLAIGAVPDTATETASLAGSANPSGSPDWPVALVLVPGLIAFVGTARSGRSEPDVGEV